MVELDKVIKSLEKCVSGTGCRGCWYSDPDVYTSGECLEALHKDTLELLKKLSAEKDDFEIQLEVYRMNLGNVREECNRLEDENRDLRREVAAGVLRGMPNDWGEYPPEFPREGM